MAGRLAYRLLEAGAALHPLEVLLLYACPLLYAAVAGPRGAALWDVWLWNAGCQAALFAAVVQLPTFVTGKMSYVDIGWPVGVVVLGVNALLYAEGTPTRRYLVAAAIIVHGLRMAVGALVLFFPYVFKEDLSRYQYARTRWVAHTNAPGWWWAKQQHDTAMQAYANAVVLAGPVLLIATNTAPEIHALEYAGFAAWAVFWCLESVADGQKVAFVAAAKRAGDVRTAVLGHPPYNTAAYSLWTWCRHPNYFCEWMCWNAVVLMAVPSAAALVADATQPLAARAGVLLVLYFTSRTFYDCLVHWTGAGPAEARSVKRRPAFREYQAQVNVLLPAWAAAVLPFCDNHRTPGWPLCVHVWVPCRSRGACWVRAPEDRGATGAHGLLPVEQPAPAAQGRRAEACGRGATHPQHRHARTRTRDTAAAGGAREVPRIAAVAGAHAAAAVAARNAREGAARRAAPRRTRPVAAADRGRHRHRGGAPAGGVPAWLRTAVRVYEFLPRRPQPRHTARQGDGGGYLRGDARHAVPAPPAGRPWGHRVRQLIPPP